MSPPTNNWRYRQTEHFVEIERTSQYRTQNINTHNRTTQKNLKNLAT